MQIGDISLRKHGFLGNGIYNYINCGEIVNIQVCIYTGHYCIGVDLNYSQRTIQVSDFHAIFLYYILTDYPFVHVLYL